MILDLRSEDEDGDGEWWDEEGRLAAIVPARAELAGGDRRLLYLAWLLCLQNQKLDDDVPEPPVPAGLATLSGPLQALADFLRLDPDLLAAAAAGSLPLVDVVAEDNEPSRAEHRWKWVGFATVPKLGSVANFVNACLQALGSPLRQATTAAYLIISHRAALRR